MTLATNVVLSTTVVICPKWPTSGVYCSAGYSGRSQPPVAVWLPVCGQTVASVWSGVPGQRAVSLVGSAWRRADVCCVMLLTAESVREPG